MQTLPEAFKSLAEYNQFILYKLVKKPDDLKYQKLPVDHRTLQVFKKDDGWQDDPQAWTDVHTAMTLASMCGDQYGVGFFFTANDPFYFLDIDHCLTADNNWSPLAQALMSMLPGAAIEISQSGEGLHVFGRGVVPEHACKNVPLDIELYTESRFVALTGNNVVGNCDTDNSATLSMLVAQYFQPKIVGPYDEWTTSPVPEWNGLENDDELIEKALKSGSAANKFGSRASFSDLWTCNVVKLADAYPADTSDTGHYDQSSADAAIASHLAFWTGKNCDRILSLMMRSGLVRDKWQREKYIKDTIQKAVAMQVDVYAKKKPKTEPPRVSVGATNAITEPVLLDAYQFMGVTQQLEHFKGCVYVSDIHKVFTPSGALLKSEQFNASYGGYVFQLESNASGKVTRKAWEAFVESQAIRYPKADSRCFKPDLPSGSLIECEGRILVNTYVPIVTPSTQGDVSPFLNHLTKLLPKEYDRSILLAYMAACIQHKGIKFQWAPLIQGAEGNGKTLLTRCVAFAIGKRYTHMPKADQIGEKFNTWLFDKLFIGVEDIYVPNHKFEIMEILKPMITADEYERRDMAVAGIMNDLCCNFIFNSNHKDAVRKTRNDRRFSIFYSAQQEESDIERDGMGGNYFPDLYHWLKTGGYAIVAHYLGAYVIPDELNPAVACHRAPITSTTEEAILSSVGGIEQEILEAIDECQIGFANGWISSMALTRLLEQHRKANAITRIKRKEILESLGYEYHPGLKEGRVNNIITIDQGKPRLFIKKGHIHANLTNSAEIVRTYIESQTATPTNIFELPTTKRV